MGKEKNFLLKEKKIIPKEKKFFLCPYFALSEIKPTALCRPYSFLSLQREHGRPPGMMQKGRQKIL
ncbi:MAG: hypothetical protein J6T94_08600 [Bacteroidaceae bacterium]|nr:hypothetical protein [Bacteroidaceae bacterium]